MSYDSEVLADSPASFYLLTETSGTWADSGSANKALDTISGSPTYAQTGPDGTACAVSWGDSSGGTEHYVRSSATIGTGVTSTGLTFECWFYLSSAVTNDTALVGCHYGYGDISRRPAGLFISASGKVGLWWGSSASSGSTYLSSSAVSTGQWYHAVGVIDGSGNGKIRLNKADVASGSRTLSLDSSAYMFMHGGGSRSGMSGDQSTVNLTDCSPVLIAKPAFYRTPLSNTRIDVHYDAMVSTSGTLAAPTATATATAPTPTLTGQRVGTLTAPTATASATAPTPTLTGQVAGTLNAPTATATATAPAATLTGASSVPGTLNAPAATATATAPTQTLTGLRVGTLTAPTATAAAQAPTPTLTGLRAGILAAPAATATAAAPAALLTGAARLGAPTATATATTLTPTLTGAAVLAAPTAEAFAEGLAAVLTGIAGAHVDLTVTTVTVHPRTAVITEHDRTAVLTVHPRITTVEEHP